MISWIHILQWRAKRHPDLLALADDHGQSLTYAELADEIELLAGGWADLGVRPGDLVPIIARNRIDWITHMFALDRVGAVPAAVNWRLAAPELRTLLEVMAPRAAVVDEPELALLDAAAPGLDRVVMRSAAADGTIEGRASDDFRGPSPAWPAEHLHSYSPCVLLHTSGTTSAVPKLITITHGRLVSSGTYLKLVVPEAGEGARHLRAMPMFHMAGLANITFPLFTGGTCHIQSSFRAEDFVDALADKKITFTNLVPSAIAMTVAEIRGRGEPVDLSSLTEIGYGASPIAPDALREAIETLGCRFRQHYGCTETGGFPVATLEPSDHYPESPHLNTAGRPALNWDVRLIDDAGDDVPDGVPGEIVVRGSDPIDGYWNNPEATAEAMTPDGYWRIGDVAIRDENGYLTIIDRKKDMIVSGGENVYPAEVESVLAQYPGLSEVSVIGVPHPRWGESVHAVLVLEPGSEQDEATVQAWCRERLAGFKCPSSVEFLDELPRNATGKILKRALRDKHWSNNDRGVA